MKKYNHPSDEFFREALKDHRMEPSDAARKAFLKDVSALPAVSKKGRTGLIVLSAAIALVGMGIILWFATEKKSSVSSANDIKYTAQQSVRAENFQPKQPQQVGVENIQSQQPPHQVGVENIQSHQQPKKVGAENIQPKQQQQQQQQQSVRAENFQPQRQPQSGMIKSPVLTSEAETTALTAINNQVAIISEPPAKSIDDISVNPSVTNSDTTVHIKKPDSPIPPVSGARETPPPTYRETKKMTPFIGVYYTPEWMFNTLEGTKFVNNFGLEGTFHFGRFSIRTGAGFSITKGTNELIVAYNDFLGSYNKLDSMKFTWNNPAQQYVPKLYMSNQDVWDSLMKVDYARVVKRYTYLQIPMIMGYDFVQSDKISVGVRVGPVLSVLLATKQLSAAYDPGNKRVVSINDIAPEQVSLNWQAMAGLNTSIRVTKALQFEAEPSIRYYFNSVYEKPVPSWKPWSISIRLAMMLYF